MMHVYTAISLRLFGDGHKKSDINNSDIKRSFCDMNNRDFPVIHRAYLLFLSENQKYFHRV